MRVHGQVQGVGGEGRQLLLCDGSTVSGESNLIQDIGPSEGIAAGLYY